MAEKRFSDRIFSQTRKTAAGKTGYIPNFTRAAGITLDIFVRLCYDYGIINTGGDQFAAFMLPDAVTKRPQKGHCAGSGASGSCETLPVLGTQCCSDAFFSSEGGETA